MTRRLIVLIAFGALLAAGVKVATPATAAGGVERALAAIRSSNGHYARGAATLGAADCSGLVSVAQSIATGQPPHRLGNTHSLLAGNWPGAVPGATPGDAFVIGVSPSHMVASLGGVNIEARQSGEPFRIGADAMSPWDGQFVAQYHIAPQLIGA